MFSQSLSGRLSSLRVARACASFVTLTASIVACSSDLGQSGGGSAGSGGTGSSSAGSGGQVTSTGGVSGALAVAGSANGGNASAGSAGASGSGGSAGANAGTGGLGGTSGAGGAAAISHAADAAYCSAQLDQAASDFKGFLGAYKDPTKIPRAVQGNAVTSVGIGDWTAGFDAGNLWLLYEHTQDQTFLTAAQNWTKALYSQRLRTDTHDIGFVIMSSYGQGYRITQNADYAPVITTAAQSLSTRFNATVGCTKSWDGTQWPFPVIIDNMMNLELLYRGTSLGGSSNFADIAVKHATTTKLNHFRPDYSSYHLVSYDPNTGAVLAKQTVQGLSDDSAWARGQTWGLYGFTFGYRESHTQAFLDQAVNIAEFYTKHPDFPDDNVPYFDFSVLQHPEIQPYRDASAGAVAASGLLELATYVPAEAAERYRAFAIKTLRSLSSPAYRAATGTNGYFLLLHSVGNYPGGTEIDVAINYADYYYLEALGRCAQLK